MLQKRWGLFRGRISDSLLEELDSQELSSIRATLDEMILDVDDPMFFVTKEGPVQGDGTFNWAQNQWPECGLGTDKPFWRDVKRNVYGHRGEGRCRGHEANTIVQEACLFNRGCLGIVRRIGWS